MNSMRIRRLSMLCSRMMAKVRPSKCYRRILDDKPSTGVEVAVSNVELYGGSYNKGCGSLIKQTHLAPSRVKSSSSSSSSCLVCVRSLNYDVLEGYNFLNLCFRWFRRCATNKNKKHAFDPRELYDGELANPVNLT